MNDSNAAQESYCLRAGQTSSEGKGMYLGSTGALLQAWNWVQGHALALDRRQPCPKGSSIGQEGGQFRVMGCLVTLCPPISATCGLWGWWQLGHCKGCRDAICPVLSLPG